MQSSASGPSARPHRAPAVRSAFTLLELLIAIAIIGILASLVLTVAGSARKQATNTQVSVDIQDLAKGIASFKQKFGVEPPSHVTLYEQASGWSGDPRSMGIIRQIWPQFDFTYAAEGGQIDINGDGFFDGDGTTNPAAGAIPLSGAECLVFFLGGVPGNPAGTYPNHYFRSPVAPAGAPSGFSQNPADPFNVLTQTTAGVQTRTVVGTNRDRFAELDFSRLFLYVPNSANPASQHVVNIYRDTLPGQTQPYLYYSSYNGQGYDVANEVQPSPPGGTFTDVYRQGPNGFTSSSPSPPWNPNSYQIISPGADTFYGVGGQYDQNNAGTLLVNTPGGSQRAPERDNITNFSSGPLAP